MAKTKITEDLKEKIMDLNNIDLYELRGFIDREIHLSDLAIEEGFEKTSIVRKAVKRKGVNIVKPHTRKTKKGRTAVRGHVRRG